LLRQRGGYIPDNDGDYSLFSTDTWQQLRKEELPEFEELAAMESGFTATARSSSAAMAARARAPSWANSFPATTSAPLASALLPAACIADADDNAGAPVVAVISYENWQHNYAAESSVIGSTFWVNTKPVTIAGVAPRASMATA
jgi:macrolide transport system ATP-binding/permease protein